MKIDKKKLIELLVDKTGMEEPEIESQLKELIQRIVDAAERGKALEIKEFGLFYFDENGDLKFDPSKELSTEINFKYAGMDPIELSSARRTSEAADETSETETEPKPEEETELKKKPEPEEEKKEPESKPESTKKSGPESETKEEKTPEEKGDKKDAEKSEEKTKEQDKEEPVEASGEEETEPFEDYAPREDDPFGGLLGDASKKMSETEEEDEEPVKAEPKQEKQPAVAKKQDKKASKPVVKKQKKMDPAMIIIGVIIVFVLLIGGYFIIANLSSQSGSGDTPEEQSASVGTSQPEQIDAPAVTPEVVEPDEEEEVLNEAAGSQAENSEESNDQPTYGLTGRLVDTANNGFSIVVHSLRREANARDVAASLSEEGYRVLVSSRNVSGETVWRVGLGQFSSIADAQEAAQELPEPLNTNNFIQRIQTN
jgi:flagellar basal body-associated protein FliL